MTRRNWAFLLLASLGCEDAPMQPSPAVGGSQPATATRPAPAATAPAAGSVAATPSGGAAATAEAHAEPPREFTESDFMESPQNRDPFRSVLAEVAGPKNVQSEWEVLLKKYPLDDLKLIAIVSGGTAPRAMFQDPTGTGVTVKRGDRMSKAEGKITKILSDRVIVEIEDTQAGRTKPEVVRRELVLHPEEPVQ